MPKQFEIIREFEVQATPEQVWEAITTGTAGWLWPLEYEPREGGAAPFGGTVTAWDPPHRLTGRVESPEGVENQTFNQLDHVIEPREGGRAWVRYVHSGIFVDDWDNQYDGADKHTDFYLHTLRQYLEFFPGRTAAYAAAEGPAASTAPDAFEVLGRALGLADDASAGTKVRVGLPGPDAVDAVIDYRNANFIGLRTGDALYRFFGRNAFGAPIGIVVHRFGTGADSDSDSTKATERAWQKWIDGLFV
ncbi:SRPBCC domain-containing protein [Streptomyces sp. H10-C2]|uniref:SRPBCC family protein n=1 Tax=unclassified Streptomyces TaxID=2593676 RepID=UPI0024BAA375|nr:MULTISPECIES: SRPBCC domain-containing protein [unclassified Streptomyces]MDJ0341905.1 SRPBCC domain-containing protein [Streptomyces sp. PH10-H1]MDJ0370341.1 SRPBCC domain-containing protein [Streptomyces sp. H10-C2]